MTTGGGLVSARPEKGGESHGDGAGAGDEARTRFSRRRLLIAGATGAALLSSADALASSAPRSAAQGQTPLPSSAIPKYRTALPTFAGRRVDESAFTTRFTEF